MQRQRSSAKRYAWLLLAFSLLGSSLLPVAIASSDAGPIASTDAVPTIAFEARSPQDAIAATLPDGEVLIAGGFETPVGEPRRTTYLASAELFNSATETFTKLTGPGRTLTEPREGAAAAALPNGQILIAGGSDGAYLASAELFDSATDTFKKLTGPGRTLSQARMGAAAATLPSGQVLIVGGFGNLGSGPLSSAELFDPATDTFAKLSGPGEALTERRTHPVAATLPSGEVLITSGINAELFSPSTDTFTKLAGQLLPDYPGAVAVSLQSGEVLIVGLADGILSRAELFNPATEVFTELTGSGQSPIQPHEGGVAAPLPNGDVLIAEGESRDGDHPAGPELFDPANDTFTTLTATMARSEVPGSAKVNESLVLVAYASSGVAPALSSATPSVCTYSEDRSEVAFKAEGTCTIVAHVSGASGYAAAQAQRSIQVSRNTPSIDLVGLPARAIVGQTRPVEGYALRTTKLSSATPSVCSLHHQHRGNAIPAEDSAEVRFDGVGRCTLVARTTADRRYFAAEARKSVSVAR